MHPQITIKVACPSHLISHSTATQATSLSKDSEYERIPRNMPRLVIAHYNSLHDSRGSHSIGNTNSQWLPPLGNSSIADTSPPQERVGLLRNALIYRLRRRLLTSLLILTSNCQQQWPSDELEGRAFRAFASNS